MAKLFNTQAALQAGYSQDEINSYLSKNKDITAQPTTQPKSAGNPLASILPILGGIGGDIVGGPVGGAVGSGIGEGARQLFSGEGFDLGKIGQQATFGGLGGVLGKVLGIGGKVAAKTVGKGLEDAGENLALKTLRPTKSQLTNFADRHGEDLAKVIQNEKLVGKGASDIYSSKIEPLQESFDQIVNKSGVKVDQNTLINNFNKKIQVLRESPSSIDQKLADNLEGEMNNIVSKAGDGPIDVSQLNKFRKIYDSKVKDFAIDPMQAGHNRLAGNALRETVQQAADQAGLKGTDNLSLKELGKKLSKLHDVHDIAALQENVGRGSMPIGMTTLLGGGVGAGMGGIGGGIPGAIGMAAATKVANSPSTLSFLSKGATRVGQELQNPNTQLMKILGAGGATIGQGAVRLPSSIIQGGPEDQNPTNNQDYNKLNHNPLPVGEQGNQSNNENYSSNSNEFNQNSTPSGGSIPQSGNKQFITPDMVTLAYLSMPKDQADRVKSAYDAQSLGQSNKPLSAASQTQVNLAKSGLRGLQKATDLLQKDPSLLAKNEIPGKFFSREFDSALTRSVEALLRARSGAAVPDSEVKRYLSKFAPKLGDDGKTISFKLQQLQQDFMDAINGASNTNNTPEDILGTGR